LLLTNRPGATAVRIWIAGGPVVSRFNPEKNGPGGGFMCSPQPQGGRRGEKKAKGAARWDTGEHLGSVNEAKWS